MTLTLATGFGLVESPRWHDGRLWFADWIAGEIRVVDPDGGTSVELTHPSMPLCFDFLPGGDLLIVSNAEHALLRRRDGVLHRYADLTPLSAIGANDIVVDGRGNAYVDSNDAEFGATAPPGGPATGRVYLVPADGSADGPARLVADDLDFPNGMAVTPDNRTLIVAESYRHRLSAFDIAADGSLSGRRVWAELGALPPDGITIDADGAVWVASVPDRRCVRVAEGGAVLDAVDYDQGAFACVLGGADGRTLYAVGATWPGVAGLAGTADWQGSVWSSPAPAPRAGWPGN